MNRSSLFRVTDIGKTKLAAVVGSSIPGKAGIAILPHSTRVTSTTSLEGLIIDCRDTIDPDLLPDNVWVKASYNGGSAMSWHFLPNVTNHAIWRSNVGDNSYEITPSFYVPAAMQGLILRMFSMTRQITNLDPSKHSRMVRFNIDDAIKTILKRKEDE
jgi:hypothetical protein